MIRTLFMLTLLLTAFRGGAGIDRSQGSDAMRCVTTHSCLVEVATTDCCGDRVKRMVCPHSGGDCQCQMSPIDRDHHPNPMPAPDRGQNLVLGLPEGGPGLHCWAIEATPAIRQLLDAPGLHALHTHNEMQALLGIWRT